MTEENIARDPRSLDDVTRLLYRWVWLIAAYLSTDPSSSFYRDDRVEITFAADGTGTVELYGGVEGHPTITVFQVIPVENEPFLLSSPTPMVGIFRRGNWLYYLKELADKAVRIKARADAEWASYRIEAAGGKYLWLGVDDAKQFADYALVAEPLPFKFGQ